MKLRFLVPAFVLALTTVGSAAPNVAHAQAAGLYFNPIVSRISNSTADSGPFAFLGQNSKSATFGGVDFGGYYNFLHGTGYDVGVDIREEIQHSNNAGLSSFMVGPRVAFKPMAFKLSPYVQFGVGAGRSHSPLSPVSTTKLEVDVLGGIDRRINRHLDLRIVEIGYGEVTTASSSQHNGPVSIPAARLLNFSTGLVIRLP